MNTRHATHLRPSPECFEALRRDAIRNALRHREAAIDDAFGKLVAALRHRVRALEGHARRLIRRGRVPLRQA